MQVFVNFPETENEIKVFQNHLAIFKSELLLKTIEDIPITDEIKDKVLEKVLEILDEKSKDSII